MAFLKKVYRHLLPILFLAFLNTISTPAFAQLGDAGAILRSSMDDANLLLENYFRPLGKGFGSNLNSGWVNSAKPYRPLGFDIRVNATVARVPSSDEFFNLAEIGLSPEIEIIGNPVTSTAVGDIQGPTLRRTETITDPVSQQSIETELFNFEMPEGYGTPLVPAPMAQITVGFLKDTDLTLRFIPDTGVPGVDDLEVGLFGFGVKHGLNQWLPGGDLLPIDLSIQFGFTNFDSEIDFEVLPDVEPSDPQTDNPFNDSVWEGQKAVLETNAFTGNLLIGKTFPVLSLWGGVGLQSSTVSVKTEGAFPVIIPNEAFVQNPQTEKPFIVEQVDDPIDFEIDGANTVHATAGLRIRLAIFTISGSYTVSEYDVASLGVGFSFR